MTTIRTIHVLFKLLPSIFALRKDRKKWINQEKNQIDSKQFRKNARKVLDTFKKKIKLILNNLEKMHVKYLTLSFR